MSLRSSLIVVLVTAAALLLGFVGVVILGRTAQAVRASVTSETARQAFVATWRPPNPESIRLDGILPARLGDMAATNRATFPESDPSGVKLPGYRTFYVAPTGFTVEVLACPLPPVAAQDALKRAVAAVEASLEGRTGTRMSTRINDRWQFSTSNPPEHLEVWSLHGWLFVFRANQEIPPGFIRSYLEAIAEPAKNGRGAPTPVETPRQP